MCAVSSVLAWKPWGVQPVVPVYLNMHRSLIISVMEKYPVTGTNQLALTWKENFISLL